MRKIIFCLNYAYHCFFTAWMCYGKILFIMDAHVSDGCDEKTRVFLEGLVQDLANRVEKVTNVGVMKEVA